MLVIAIAFAACMPFTDINNDMAKKVLSINRNNGKGRQSTKTLPAFFYALNLSSSSIKQNRPNVLLMTKKFNLFRLGADDRI